MNTLRFIHHKYGSWSAINDLPNWAFPRGRSDVNSNETDRYQQDQPLRKDADIIDYFFASEPASPSIISTKFNAILFQNAFEW